MYNKSQWMDRWMAGETDGFYEFELDYFFH